MAFNRKKLQEIAKLLSEQEIERRKRRRSKEFREAKRREIEEYFHPDKTNSQP